MITAGFEYHRPTSLDEALMLMERYGESARPLAGGTDLVVRLKDGADEPGAVVDLKGIKELERLEASDNALLIGALVTFTDIIESDLVREKLPLLWEAATTVASMGVRNRATLVGNICSAVPSLDSGPALLVHDAEVLIRGPDGQRRIPITEWFTGPKRTALGAGELVTGITVPFPSDAHGGCYARSGRYAGEDLAQVGAAALALDGNRYHVAFCAVGPVATRARDIEAVLDGRPLEVDIIEEAVALVPDAIAPITDIRASKEYRAHMAGVLLTRALRTAVRRLAGDGPQYGERVV